MKSEDGNYHPPPVLASVAEISESTSNPATVPSTSPSKPLLPPNVEVTFGSMLIPPLTPYKPPLPPSVSTSNGSAAELSGRTDLSVCALRLQQARDDLVHLLSVALLTKSPPLIEAIFGRLSPIT